ncbi:MAG TPA: replication-relaxation family protein [Thermoanaerobaculia bacterium]|nr:replication-relaxation family protein [Thermoanaerobaculia bacterium]
MGRRFESYCRSHFPPLIPNTRRPQAKYCLRNFLPARWLARKRGPTTILTVDQLPDSRRAILTSLKRRGPATIAQLADTLGLTGEAVRQQLLQLHRDGWVEARIERSEERARTGRPATIYRLSEAGDHLFPKHYDTLSVSMLDAVAEEIGEHALTRVLARLSDEKVAQFGAGLRGLTLAQKVAALKDWYFDDDPFMEIEEDGGSYLLVERNCPYLNMAMRRPVFCSVSVNALARVVGYKIVREERFQNGDGRCVFRIAQDQPIDPDSAEFELEPPLNR